MTECERIISKGFLPKNFFEPEIICDFYVDEKRKKIWAILLDILNEIDRVCKKNNIQYTLFFGSLLGAVRHHGFIPWDDDIDIAMPRADYERFISLGKDFAQPYFLQTPYTDPGYFYSMTKVRNSNTAAVVECFQYEKFNQGICVDVFPLDSYNEEGMNEKYSLIYQLTRGLSAYMRRNNLNLDEVQQQRVQKYLNRNPFQTYELIHQLCRADEGAKCRFIGCLSSWIYGPTAARQTYPVEYWNEYTNVNFQGISVPIPKAYKEVLRITYGNYMDLPPTEQRGSWHYGITIDTDNPFCNYLKNPDNAKMK